nr:MAG TPA: hypothetical protein [Caudoviricetes sp.]
MTNFLTTHPVLALPCCTESERDLITFLALMPAKGWVVG